MPEFFLLSAPDFLQSIAVTPDILEVKLDSKTSAIPEPLLSDNRQSSVVPHDKAQKKYVQFHFDFSAQGRYHFRKICLQLQRYLYSTLQLHLLFVLESDLHGVDQW